MRQIFICDETNPAKAAVLCERYDLGIEIQAFYDPAYFDSTPDAVEQHLALLGNVPERSSHGCFGDLCAGSFDPLVREVARLRYQQSYDFARQLGAGHLVLHHGYVPHTSPPDRWLVRCSAFWKDFLQGKGPEIRIHLENLLELDAGLLAEVIDAIDSPLVDANLDLGHVACNSPTPLTDWIHRLGKRIGYLHLHDNHGERDEHLTPGKGSIPLREALELVSETAPDAIWAIESDIDEMEEAILWLKTNGFGRKFEPHRSE